MPLDPEYYAVLALGAPLSIAGMQAAVDRSTGRRASESELQELLATAPNISPAERGWYFIADRQLRESIASNLGQERSKGIHSRLAAYWHALVRDYPASSHTRVVHDLKESHSHALVEIDLPDQIDEIGARCRWVEHLIASESREAQTALLDLVLDDRVLLDRVSGSWVLNRLDGVSAYLATNFPGATSLLGALRSYVDHDWDECVASCTIASIEAQDEDLSRVLRLLTVLASSRLGVDEYHRRAELSALDEASRATKVGNLGRLIERERNTQDLATALLDQTRREIGPKRNRRVVAVVGAGLNASGGYPAADDIKNILLGRLAPTNSSAIVDQLTSANVGEIKLAAGLVGGAVAADALEDTSLGSLTRNVAMSPPARRAVLSVMHSEYDLGTDAPELSPPPHLAAELVAHLVRHNAIDQVVDLNADEVLDRVLADEIEPDVLEFVYDKDSADRASSQRSQHRIRKTVLKLTGTLSEVSSLAMFEEVQSDGPARMDRNSAARLKFLQTEILPPPSDSKDDVPIVLIVIGCSLRHKVLQEAIEGANIETIFRIDVARPRIESRSGPLAAPGHLAEKLIVSDDGPRYLERVLAEMVSQSSDLSPAERAHRHFLMDEVFSAQVRRHEPVNRRALLAVELVLAALRTKGLLSIEYLNLRGRIRRWSSIAREVLKNLVEDERLLVNVNGQHQVAGLSYRVVDIEHAIEHVVGIARNQGVLSERRLESIRQRLRAVARAEAFEVALGEDSLIGWEFVNPRRLYSLAEMREFTAGLFVDDDIEVVLVVSERGQFLCAAHSVDAVSRRQSDVPLLELVRAEPYVRTESGGTAAYGTVLHQDELALRLATEQANVSIETGALNIRGEVLPPSLMQMPAQEFELNLSVGLRYSNFGSLQPVRGLAFRRNRTDPLVYPVALEGEDDLAALYKYYRHERRKYFVRHWSRDFASALGIEWLDLIVSIMKGSAGDEGSPLLESADSVASRLSDPEAEHRYVVIRPLGKEDVGVGVISFAVADVPAGSADPVAMFESVAVRREWQGRGIGTLLMRRMEDEVGRSLAGSGRAGRRIVVEVRDESRFMFLRSQGYLEMGDTATGRRFGKWVTADGV